MNIKKDRILFVLLLCLISYTLLCCGHSPAGQIVSIENGKIKLGFERNTGAFIVFRDLVNSHEFLDTKIITGSIWEVDFLHASEIEAIDMTTPSDFHFSKMNPYTLILTWDNFTEIENNNFKITTVITLDKDQPLSSWKISVEGIEGEMVHRIAFPKIEGIKDLGDEFLAIPLMMGELLKDPRARLSKIENREKKIEWIYPGGLSMQCLALYDTSKCIFYASSNDSLAYRKSFSFSLDDHDNLSYQMNNYPALDSTLERYSIPYEAVIGSFKGDWITVAEQYRKWGSQQKWCTESRFGKGLTPSWLDETALWVWNRGKSDNVLIPAIDLKQRLGLPVSVHWHWWHGCSYDDGFPEYFPPREGKEKFMNTLSFAQQRGIRAIIYMNQFLWGTSTDSWERENAYYYSVKDIKGNIVSRVYNIFSGNSMAYMCIATQFWKDKYASLCDSAVNVYNTNGVYRDMACGNQMCYDKNHGHQIGGGNYWFKHFCEHTCEIYSSISQKNQPILAGEGCCEAYLPYLDLFLTLRVSRERFAGIGALEPIPFFQAVYHQYGITYGNYSSLLIPPYDELWPKEFAPKDPLELLAADFNKQFLMEQARSFVWGMQPTIANYQSFLASERKEEIDYLMNLARVRYQGLKYLLHGKFLRSPEMHVPQEELKISRLSIYAGKNEESVTVYQKSFPLIYSGTWRADDNHIGIALASISDDPFRVNFSFDANAYNLPPSGTINIMDIDGKRKLSEYSDHKVRVDFELPPKGLCILEIVSKKY